MERKLVSCLTDLRDDAYKKVQRVDSMAEELGLSVQDVGHQSLGLYLFFTRKQHEKEGNSVMFKNDDWNGKRPIGEIPQEETLLRKFSRPARSYNELVARDLIQWRAFDNYEQTHILRKGGCNVVLVGKEGCEEALDVGRYYIPVIVAQSRTSA
jgi:hypothetical protein